MTRITRVIGMTTGIITHLAKFSANYVPSSFAIVFSILDK